MREQHALAERAGGTSIGRWGIMRGMKKLYLFAALVLLSVLAVLGSSCTKPVDLKAVVLPQLSCELEKHKRHDKCEVCIKSSCCTELLTCANAAPCPCWLSRRLGMYSTEENLKECGPAPDTYKALGACLDARCPEDCTKEDALAKHPLVGKPAPAIVAEPVGGDGPKTLDEARGKVVIVEFWATWCPACKRTFPRYQAIADQHPSDVAVLGVAVDDPEHMTREKILAVAKEHGARFAIVWDSHMRMEARYTMPNGLPTTFIIDQGGTVRRVITRDDPTVADYVQALLSAHDPPPREGGSSP